MKKACIVIGDNFFQKNRLFDLDDPIANRDNCLYPFFLLKQKLDEKGFNLATSDLHPAKESDLVIYFEMPKVLPSIDELEKSYLLLFESELIRPDNWELSKHKAFKKVFTWHDSFVGTKNYYKMNFSLLISKKINKDLSRKNKLCTLIAGNKRVKHRLELYSKRIEAIRWFEKKHPNDFDLFGMGWDRFRFTGIKVVRALNKLTWLTKLLAPTYPSYKGPVSEKKIVLEKYKFAICFENGRDIPGYITEKIFDCFFAGCIPIYWGANNVTAHIPKECFIDMRDFASYEDLYLHINSMSDEEYSQRLDLIQHFLNSDKAKLFSADYIVSTMLDQILNT